MHSLMNLWTTNRRQRGRGKAYCFLLLSFFNVFVNEFIVHTGEMGLGCFTNKSRLVALCLLMKLSCCPSVLRFRTILDKCADVSIFLNFFVKSFCLANGPRMAHDERRLCLIRFMPRKLSSTKRFSALLRGS